MSLPPLWQTLYPEHATRTPRSVRGAVSPSWNDTHVGRGNGTLSFAFAPLSTLHSCWRIFTLHDTFALDQDRERNDRTRPFVIGSTNPSPPPKSSSWFTRQLALLSSIWRACMRACVRANIKYLLIRNYTINSIRSPYFSLKEPNCESNRFALNFFRGKR